MELKMKSRTNLNTLLFMLVFLLAMVGTTFAEPFFPTHVGLRWEYKRWDSANPVNEWTVHMELDHKTTINSQTYFHLQRWNHENDGALEDMDYFRSTEQAVYGYNPSGTDYVVHQAAPVGTKWHYPLGDGDPDYLVREIIAIEPVTVPYGTFDTAYKQRVYTCLDPDTLEGKSTDWYEWTVAGVGFVKGVNDWGDNPPLTMELVRVVLPESSIEVVIDIKPGSYPNAINKNGKGVIPVAILGSADFDVTQIDVSTLSFAGLAVRVKGNDQPQCSVEDVSGDFTTPEGAPDGYLDLVCQFVDDPATWTVGDGEATLTGQLLDGTPFEGTDSIKVVQ